MYGTKQLINFQSLLRRWANVAPPLFAVWVLGPQSLTGCGSSRHRDDAATPAKVENQTPPTEPSCLQRGGPNRREGRGEFRTLIVGGAKGVIVPYEAYFEADWTPGEAEIRVFEHGVLSYLKSLRPDDSPDLYLKAGQYNRQYIGFCKDGKQNLYALFMCETVPGWENSVVSVHDGEDCYFSIYFDVAAREYRYVK